MLHRYTYLLSQQRLADLQRAAERERLARLAERQYGIQRFYYRWARQFGEQMMRWGQSLLHYGAAASFAADRSSPDSIVPAKDFRALKVIHASSIRRTKWN